MLKKTRRGEGTDRGSRIQLKNPTEIMRQKHNMVEKSLQPAGSSLRKKTLNTKKEDFISLCIEENS
jgi:hypothetical protein